MKANIIIRGLDINNLKEFIPELSLIATLFLLTYLCSAVAYYSLMGSRGMRYKFLAFIPFVNTSFVLGRISDSINNEYKKKTRHRYILVASKFVSLISGAAMFSFLYLYTPKFITNISAGLTINSAYYNNLVSELSSLPLEISFLISLSSFIYIATMIINIVLGYNSFYNIYREYDNKNSKFYFIIAVFSTLVFNIQFMPPFFVFTMRNNTPIFKVLNTRSSLGESN